MDPTARSFRAASPRRSLSPSRRALTFRSVGASAARPTSPMTTSTSLSACSFPRATEPYTKALWIRALNVNVSERQRTDAAFLPRCRIDPPPGRFSNTNIAFALAVFRRSLRLSSAGFRYAKRRRGRSLRPDYSTAYPSACALFRTRASRVTMVTSCGGSPSNSAVARCTASSVRIGSTGNGRRTRASTASVTATT